MLLMDEGPLLSCDTMFLEWCKNRYRLGAEIRWPTDMFWASDARCEDIP